MAIESKSADAYSSCDERPSLSMAMLAVLVGIIAGLGAVVFRCLIAFIHNLSFSGIFSFYYNANEHTPESWLGWWLVLIPVAGAFIVAFLVKNWAPEAKGHGVPEVLDAIYFNEGRIRPIVAVIKSIASAVSIGTGGSVGREGPIIQIGSTFGSVLGSFMSMPASRRVILIAAGAAGGITATFNCPIGGVLFAIELMLPVVSAGTLLPVMIATAVACHIGRIAFGVEQSFYIPSLEIPQTSIISIWIIILSIPLGIMVGLMSVAFIRGIYWSEDKFDSIRGGYYLRHPLGMLIVGIEICLFMTFSGHYYIQGVGYAGIMDVLRSTLFNPWFLILLLAGKFLATCLTLGSGASGGIFSPSLFMGAMLGGAFGTVFAGIFPDMTFAPVAFAIAGMAAAVGGSTGAVLTGIVMVFEMTRDYSVILPVLVTSIVAYATRKSLCDPSIYTLKLIRRGKKVPEGLTSSFYASRY